MQIIPMVKEDRLKLIETAVTCMRKDPSYNMVLRGLADGPKYLREVLKLQLKYGIKLGRGWKTEDDKAFLISHYHHEEKWWPNCYMSMEMYQTYMDVFKSKYDRKDYQANMDKIRIKDSFKWRERAEKGEYYYIDLVCVHPDYRKNGYFRALMEPVLAISEQEQIPILVDTYNPDNVPVFKHYGFEPVEMLKSPTIRMYCLKRMPGSKLPQPK